LEGFSKVISKEQDKTMSLIFSSTKRQKNVKLTAHVQKVPIYYRKLLKKYLSCETIPFIEI
jgi:hypothetical protein